MSKVAVYGVICALQCAVMIAVIHFACGLRGNLIESWFVLWLASVIGVALGLLISAMVNTNESAIQLVPLVLLPMIIFAGGFTRIEEMDKDAQAITYAMPSRWAFEAMLLVENSSRAVTTDQTDEHKARVPPRYTVVHQFFSKKPHSNGDVATCLAIMSGMAVLLLFATGLSLKLKHLQ